MNGAGFFLIIIVMFVFMWLLLIRPQRQQQRRHQEMLAALRVGDEVVTAGGIYGDVVGIEDDRVHLQVAEDVEIEVARRSIASVVEQGDRLLADEDEVEPGPEGEPVADERART